MEKIRIFEMTSTTLYINFLPCYERFCQKCVDGSCIDKEKYKTCEFSADNVYERKIKYAQEIERNDAMQT